ncbi:MAG: hypothetical protein JEZ09_19180 [Salinivirgaceae bacterium]|nr:hypothetical protein [Salinivirgaceae bacterium]
MTSIIIDNEECRPIIGFKRYHISESGQVYRTAPSNNKEKKLIKDGAPYVLKKDVFYVEHKGKLRQATCSLIDNNGKLHSLMVSELIVEAFGLFDGNYNNKKNSLEYIDGDKKNLHYSNLRICKKKYSNTKLSDSDVKKIKRLISIGYPLKHIGLLFEVSEMQISRIKTGENWGNGKRKIKAPEAPFPIEDGKIRKYIAIFDRKEVQKEIKRPFTIKRNPDDPTDNIIIGILNGYKLSLKHKNITRAQVNIEKLNKYFFS